MKTFLMLLMTFVLFFGCSDIPEVDKTIPFPHLAGRVGHTDAQLKYWHETDKDAIESWDFVSDADSLLKYIDPIYNSALNYLIKDHRCWLVQLNSITYTEKTSLIVMRVYFDKMDEFGYRITKYENIDAGILVKVHVDDPNKYCMYFQVFNEKNRAVLMSINFYEGKDNLSPESLKQL